MPDAVDLVKTIKRAALEAVNASKPVEICFGKVTSAAPLKILVEQKMTLGEAQLVLCRNVTEYTVEMTVDHYTENETEHLNAYRGRKKSPFTMGWLSVKKLSFLGSRAGKNIFWRTESDDTFSHSLS